MKRQTAFLNFRLSPALHDELKQFATKNELNESEAIRFLLKRALRSQYRQTQAKHHIIQALDSSIG